MVHSRNNVRACSTTEYTQLSIVTYINIDVFVRMNKADVEHQQFIVKTSEIKKYENVYGENIQLSTLYTGTLYK